MKSIKSFNFQDLISNYSICNIYQNKIWQYGSLSANYLTNYLKQCLGQFTLKRLGYSKWCCQNFCWNVTRARIYVVKLFWGKILLAPLFWHHMKQFSVSVCERFWKQASLKVVTYKRWSLMRGGGLQEVLFIVIWLRNFWYFEEVVSNKRWSLIMGGRKGKFDCCNMIEYHYEWS